MRTRFIITRTPCCDHEHYRVHQETQLSLTNRATRLQVSQGHQTIRCVRCGFLLVCYSNFVQRLLAKLDQYGIRGKTKEWISSFLGSTP